MDEQEKQHYLGHRKRLRDRFMADNGRTMPDYEILELLLSIAIPRRDVKPLAKNLLHDFESFANVLNASVNELKAYGLTDTTIATFKIVVSAAQRMSAQELRESEDPVIMNYDYMKDYAHMSMAYLDIEEFRAVFLDARLRVIKEEVLQRGTVDRVSVHPREVVKAALACSARSVILMHNHPGGKAEPSKDDLLLTHQIAEALEAIGIKVHDHLIITKDGCYSFNDHGLLNKL